MKSTYTGRYKTKCDTCGVRISRKTAIWSYRDRKGKMRGRCAKHL